MYMLENQSTNRGDYKCDGHPGGRFYLLFFPSQSLCKHLVTFDLNLLRLIVIKTHLLLVRSNILLRKVSFLDLIVIVVATVLLVNVSVATRSWCYSEVWIVLTVTVEVRVEAVVVVVAVLTKVAVLVRC